MKHTEIALNIIYGYRCNYVCSGCCNGSDQVQHTNFDPSLEEILASIPKLAEHFEIDPNGMITLLGGELFVYWDKIVSIAHKVRECFPSARINLYTNGHLLHQYADATIELMKTLGNVSLTITKHLLGMYETPLGEKWLGNIEKVKNRNDIIVLHADHYHVVNRIDCNIYLYDGGAWFTWYKKLNNGLIKPYASGNPAKSMQHGCASGSSCSALFGSKFYKCDSLAILPGLLMEKGQLDDVDWDKYVKKYPYIDLNKFDQEAFDYHVATFGKPIPQCDMCNDDPNNVVLWKDRDYKMIFKK